MSHRSKLFRAYQRVEQVYECQDNGDYYNDFSDHPAHRAMVDYSFRLFLYVYLFTNG